MVQPALLFSDVSVAMTPCPAKHIIANSAFVSLLTWKVTKFLSAPRVRRFTGSLLLLRRHIHIKLPEEKGISVGRLFDAFTQGRSNAVSGTGAGAQEDGIARFVRFLQSRNHFTGVIGGDASVVRPGQHQDGWIIGAVDDMMIG